MTTSIRRVVLGQRSPSISVEELEPLRLPDWRGWMISGWDETPTVPMALEDHRVKSLFPPVGGVRIWAATNGRDGDDATEVSDASTVEELVAAQPHGRWDSPDEPGMHRTDTVDVGVVISGEIVCVAEDGTREVLQPGDVYVQTGGVHNWEASSNGEPAQVVWVIFGARRERDL